MQSHNFMKTLLKFIGRHSNAPSFWGALRIKNPRYGRLQVSAMLIACVRILSIALLPGMSALAQETKPIAAPSTPAPAIIAAVKTPTPVVAAAVAPPPATPKSPATTVAAPPTTAAPAASDRNIRFQFDGIPYPDVLERFAQMANKPLV